MSNPNQGRQYSRGQWTRQKMKQEDTTVLTLDEWEKRKNGAKSSMQMEQPNISNDEDLAWQLQNQLDMEDSHVIVLPSFTLICFCMVFSLHCLISMFSNMIRYKGECMTLRRIILK